MSRSARSWGPKELAIARYSTPVRPAEIVNAGSVQRAPLMVGGLLVIAAAVALVVATVGSIRSRRHEMAVLRTLGFTGRQLRVSVRVQALTMTLAGLVVGAPLGVLFGRVAWRAFATRLGVVPTASIPVIGIAATVVGAVIIALLAAAGPARVAARATPAVPLRAE